MSQSKKLTKKMSKEIGGYRNERRRSKKEAMAKGFECLREYK